MINTRAFTRRRSKVRNTMTPIQETTLANHISWHLHKTYPGHMWMVNVHQGVVTVKNMFVSATMGFTIKVADLDADNHKLTMAGGEILERYRLKRGKLNVNELAGKKRDFAGRLAFDA